MEFFFEINNKFENQPIRDRKSQNIVGRNLYSLFQLSVLGEF